MTVLVQVISEKVAHSVIFGSKGKDAGVWSPYLFVSEVPIGSLITYECR